jgi:ATP-dependent DNA ligase
VANDADEQFRPPLPPMTARPAAALPDEERASRFAFEPKVDGWLN